MSLTVTEATTCTATRHGTRAAYIQGCRCAAARADHRRYQAWRKRHAAKVSFGAAEPLTIEVDQTREIIERLLADGWSLRRIAAAAGMKRDRLSRIRGGTSRPVRFVHMRTHRALVGLLDQEPALSDGTMIDAAPTWRLIHGLIALGYDKSWIACQLGVTRTVQFSHRLVTVANARKVRELAARTITAGPSAAARRYAAERGWTTDLLFDPTDDATTPDSDMDENALLRACAGDPVPLTKPERREVVRRLHGQGRSYDQIAERLHTHPRMVHRDLAALGLIGAAS